MENYTVSVFTPAPHVEWSCKFLLNTNDDVDDAGYKCIGRVCVCECAAALEDAANEHVANTNIVIIAFICESSWFAECCGSGCCFIAAASVEWHGSVSVVVRRSLHVRWFTWFWLKFEENIVRIWRQYFSPISARIYRVHIFLSHFLVSSAAVLLIKSIQFALLMFSVCIPMPVPCHPTPNGPSLRCNPGRQHIFITRT